MYQCCCLCSQWMRNDHRDGIGCRHSLNCMSGEPDSLHCDSPSHNTCTHTNLHTNRLIKKKSLQEEIGRRDVIVATEVLLGLSVCPKTLCNFLTNTLTCQWHLFFLVFLLKKKKKLLISMVSMCSPKTRESILQGKQSKKLSTFGLCLVWRGRKQVTLWGRRRGHDVQASSRAWQPRWIKRVGCEYLIADALGKNSSKMAQRSAGCLHAAVFQSPPWTVAATGSVSP